MVVSLVVAGISFIATLVIIALLMLAVDPAQITQEVDRGVLMDEPDAAASAPGDDDATPGAPTAH